MQDQQTALNVLKNHWQTWIVEDDFRQMKAFGLNHVRYAWFPHRSRTALTTLSHVARLLRSTGSLWAIGQYPSHPVIPINLQTHHRTYPGHGRTSCKLSPGQNPIPSTWSSTSTALRVLRTATITPVRGLLRLNGPQIKTMSRRP